MRRIPEIGGILAIVIMAGCLSSGCGSSSGGGLLDPLPGQSSPVIGTRVVSNLEEAGVFRVEANVQVRNVADVRLFDRPPTDSPGSCQVSLSPADVTVSGLGDSVTCTLSGDLYIDAWGAPSPCDTGALAGAYEIVIESGRVTEVTDNMAITGVPLEKVVSNEFSICLTMTSDCQATAIVERIVYSFGDLRVGCNADFDCDDGLFCNGVEACDLVTGCADGEAPCTDGDTCDETSDTCILQGVASAIIGPQGGVVELGPKGSLLRAAVLEIPQGAFGTEVLVTLKTAPSGLPSADNVLVLEPAINVDAGGAQPAVPVDLVFTVDSGALPPHVQLEALSVVRSDPDAEGWVLVPSIVNSTGQIVAHLDHLSRFDLRHWKWDFNSQITWTIDSYPQRGPTGYPPRLSRGEVDGAVTAAFSQTWGEELGEVGISFAIAEEGSCPDVLVLWDDSLPSTVNGQMWFRFCRDTYETQLRLSITLNDWKDWDILKDGTPFNSGPTAYTRDIQTILGHEIGHVLLGGGHIHEAEAPPLMNAEAGQVMHRLTCENRERLRRHYGMTGPYCCDGGCADEEDCRHCPDDCGECVDDQDDACDGLTCAAGFECDDGECVRSAECPAEWECDGSETSETGECGVEGIYAGDVNYNEWMIRQGLDPCFRGLLAAEPWPEVRFCDGEATLRWTLSGCHQEVHAFGFNWSGVDAGDTFRLVTIESLADLEVWAGSWESEWISRDFGSLIDGPVTYPVEYRIKLIEIWVFCRAGNGECETDYTLRISWEPGPP